MSMNEYRTKIEGIISDAAEQTKQYNQRLNKLSAEIEAAEKEAEQLFAAGNTASFKKAAQKAADVKLEHDMIWTKLNALRNDPLISPEEYKQLISEIRSECDDLTDTTLREICDMVSKINEIGQKQVDIIIEADSILERLRQDVFRDPDGLRSLKIGVQVGVYEGLHVNRGCYDVGYWINTLTTNAMYVECSKKYAAQGDSNA